MRIGRFRLMNFSVSDSIGFLGGWILFSALMIAAIIAVMLVTRAIRGRDDTSTSSDVNRAPEDDYIL